MQSSIGNLRCTHHPCALVAAAFKCEADSGSHSCTLTVHSKGYTLQDILFLKQNIPCMLEDFFILDLAVEEHHYPQTLFFLAQCQVLRFSLMILKAALTLQPHM